MDDVAGVLQRRVSYCPRLGESGLAVSPIVGAVVFARWARQPPFTGDSSASRSTASAPRRHVPRRRADGQILMQRRRRVSHANARSNPPAGARWCPNIFLTTERRAGEGDSVSDGLRPAPLFPPGFGLPPLSPVARRLPMGYRRRGRPKWCTTWHRHVARLHSGRSALAAGLADVSVEADEVEAWARQWRIAGRRGERKRGEAKDAEALRTFRISGLEWDEGPRRVQGRRKARVCR